ncbi:MAG: TatD family hydrolase [Armatimonadota bacterium]|nr:TatD family hydrolase [Armatimonadota bacterium]
MWVIDSHAHLNHPSFADDLPATLQRARAAGVRAVLVAGFDLPSSREAVRLAAEHAEVWASVGVHPHDARTCDDETLAELARLLKAPRVAAVGETGLDYYRNLSPPEAQRHALRAHLALAREAGLPVILHDRDAHADLLQILREEGVPAAGGVLHCFSGDETLARQAISLGLMVSAAGQITYGRSEALRRAVAAVPSDRLLVETDSPYLTPEPYRGRQRRNEPMRVAEVVRCVAAARHTDPESVARATLENACQLFGITITTS